jgi:hypothetical protein
MTITSSGITIGVDIVKIGLHENCRTLPNEFEKGWGPLGKSLIHKHTRQSLAKSKPVVALLK